MTVGDVISACEYINCVVLNAFGKEIMPTLEDYDLYVERLSAKDNIVQIWTYVGWDEYVDTLLEKK